MSAARGNRLRPALAFLITVSCVAFFSCGGKRPSGDSHPSSRASRATPTPIDLSTVGEIYGTVNFKGRAPFLPAIHMDADPVCRSEHHGQLVRAQDGEVNPNGTLPNAFVYVKAGAEKYNFAPPARPAVLAQEGCMYVPHVLGIQVGQPLQIVSDDPTLHNIHLMASRNPQWNVSQAPGAPPIVRVFSKPEVMMSAECNQHPWMRCYIGSVANPFYAVTGPSGRYALRGLPPGTYTIEAWTARFGRQDRRVSLQPKEKAKLDFTFEPS